MLGRRQRPRCRPGHAVQLLQSGAEFFPALETAIHSARESVWIETYIFHDDASGRRIAQALGRAVARGVAVRLVVDGFGTGMPTGEVGQVLAAQQVDLRIFRPLRRWRLERQALRRLHRKLALIDSAELFVGGINLIDDHEDPVRGRLEAPRLDFALRVRGPLVEEAMSAMAQVWRRAQPVRWPAPTQGSSTTPQAAPAAEGGPVGAGQAPAAAAQTVRAAFAERDNFRHRRTIERAYLRAIGRAHTEVLIACAYFFPGAKFRRALAEAAARGVRVRLLLQGRIEYRLPHFGTLALHEELLRAGVEIIEYQPGFLHAKLALADQWFTLGSSNIDPFSLLLAREANVIVQDDAMAAVLRARIEHAIAEGGRPVRWSHIVARPWWVRAAALGAAFVLRIGVALSGRGLRY
ncbi:MAG: cardiolipin synthase ClsB [Betaproteobacteria bacterium]|nr:cardiolipin synthase ClsB [Betaproteobacteria bacterium]